MSVKIPIADVTTAVWYGLLLVRLWRKDPESSVLPIVIGVTSSNHSGCGGLRRRVTKACPICSSRVAKPAFAVPIGVRRAKDFRPNLILRFTCRFQEVI